MTHQVKVYYTEEEVRSAAKQFYKRYRRRDRIIAGVLILLAVSVQLFFGMTWQQPVALLAILAASLLIVYFEGYRYVHNSFHGFRSMKEPTCLWQFSEENLAASSELGSMEVPWKVLAEIWCFPDVWLLYFGRRGTDYCILPISALSAEVQSLII